MDSERKARWRFEEQYAVGMWQQIRAFGQPMLGPYLSDLDDETYRTLMATASEW